MIDTMRDVNGSVTSVSAPAIAAVAPVPRPGSQPYRDCITSIHLTAVAGDVAARELLVYTWGMRDDRWTRAARLGAGERIELAVRPWAEVEPS